MAVVVACVGRAAGGSGAHAPGAGGPRSRGLQDQRCGRRAAVLRRVARVPGRPAADGRRAPARYASTSARRSSSSRGCRPMWTTGCRTSRLRRPIWRRSRRISTRVASTSSGPRRTRLRPRGAAHDRPGRQRRGVRAGGRDRGLAGQLALRAAVDAAVPHRRRRARRGQGARVLPRGPGTRRDLARRRRSGVAPAGSTCACPTAPTTSSTCSTTSRPRAQQLGSQHHACLLVPDIQAAWEVRARAHAARRPRRSAEAAHRAQQQVAVEPVRHATGRESS